MSELFQIDNGSSQRREVIKVIGVGGCGTNAVNNLIHSGMNDVEFIAANTDLSHLENSLAENKIVLGEKSTRGLGAGADPKLGAEAAVESKETLEQMLAASDMVFVTAGMGGGTGTGAAPIIADIAKDTGALVVAVVVTPFRFEGKKRNRNAREGLAKLKEKVDALIVIQNDKLLAVADAKTTAQDAYAMADNVLLQAVQGVTDLIKRPGQVNVDFADVCKIMSNSGTALMGIGEANGEGRAQKAANLATHGPLMPSRGIQGAKGVLLNITGGANVTMFEIQEAAMSVMDEADEEAEFVFGHVYDPQMDDTIQITVIATGFDETEDDIFIQQPKPTPVLRHDDFVAQQMENVVETVQEPVKKTIQEQSVQAVPENSQTTLNQASDLQEQQEQLEQEQQKRAMQQDNPFADLLKKSGMYPEQAEKPKDDDLFSSQNKGYDDYDIPPFLRKGY
ncbi:MAG: cell division protein FtsZ [Synergistaceae bacterium]|nr:cell division protein FtsZ [Synergistaceae bacterium]